MPECLLDIFIKVQLNIPRHPNAGDSKRLGLEESLNKEARFQIGQLPDFQLLLFACGFLHCSFFCICDFVFPAIA
jgi:hypothetical protein